MAFREAVAAIRVEGTEVRACVRAFVFGRVLAQVVPVPLYTVLDASDPQASGLAARAGCCLTEAAAGLRQPR